MTADDHARLQLLRRLEEVLGPEEAETLVTHLPPQPWDEIATKADIRALAARFDAVDHRFDAVNSDSASLGHRIDALRSELLGAIDRAFRRQTWALPGTMIALVALVLAAIQLGR